MIKLKRTLAVIFTAVVLCVSSAGVCEAVTSDEAVIAQDNSFTPLNTTAPDSSLKYHPDSETAKSNGALFYTQTTLLALTAGYMIVYKLRIVKPEARKEKSIRKK